MMGIASCYACWEVFGTLIPSLAHPGAYRFRGSPATLWIESVFAHLPSWAVVRDPSAANAIFQGGSWKVIWRAWLMPLTAWGGLLGVLYLMFLALMRLLRDPWVHHERLTFPLTWLPMEMTNLEADLWRSRLFWIGFSAVAMLDLLNGFHLLYPSLPYIDVKVHWFSGNLTEPRWEAVGPVPLTFHPLMLGLAFLLPADLLFSTWFFYVLGKVQLYLTGMWGMAHGSPYAFGDNVPGLLEQNVGAVLVLGTGWLWRARRFLSQRWRDALHGDAGARLDYTLLGGGSLFCGWFLCQLGFSLWAAILVLAMILLLSLLVTRLRAELGMPVHNLQFYGPDGPMIAIFGGRGLGLHGLEAFGTLFAYTRSQQGHPMPHQMEAAYMAEQSGALRKGFWWAIGIVGVLASLIGPWIFLYTVSQRGLEMAPGGFHAISEEGWTRLGAYLSQNPPPDPTAVWEMGIGASVALFLIALRQVWFSSPFHPVGYAICGSWGTWMVATPLFLALVAKVLLLRYGGLKWYRTAIPLALGLILGEFVVGAFWTVVGLMTGIQTYRIWLF